jgi:hypothetical protein
MQILLELKRGCRLWKFVDPKEARARERSLSLSLLGVGGSRKISESAATAPATRVEVLRVPWPRAGTLLSVSSTLTAHGISMSTS